MVERWLQVPVPVQWDGTTMGLMGVMLLGLLGTLLAYMKYLTMNYIPGLQAQHVADLKAKDDRYEAALRTRDEREDRIRAEAHATVKLVIDECNLERQSHAAQLALAREERQRERQDYSAQVEVLRADLDRHRREIFDLLAGKQQQSQVQANSDKRG